MEFGAHNPLDDSTHESDDPEIMSSILHHTRELEGLN